MGSDRERRLMKIMLVSNVYGALARGGAERVVAEEAEALIAFGEDVVVVSGGRRTANGERYVQPAARSPQSAPYYPPNIAFYTDLAKYGVVFRFFWHVFDIWNARSAKIFSSILRDARPDVVHTHNLMGLGFLIPHAIRRAGIRHVHTVHDVQLLDPSGLLRADRPLRLAWHQRAYVAIMRRQFGSPDVVIFPSAFHRDLHLQLGFFSKSRHVVLRNPTLSSCAPRALSASPPRFLFAGQLEQHKGISVLLDAWEKKKFAGTLEIAGGGSLESDVRHRIETMRDVRMLGRLDRVALDAAYDRTDWIVIPSVAIENAPATLMEAFGRGIPAVASATGGIPELVRDGVTGFLAAPGDAAVLSEALARAAKSGASYAAFSSQAVAAVVGLDAPTHAKKLLELYF